MLMHGRKDIAAHGDDGHASSHLGGGLHRLFEFHAATQPMAVALEFGSEFITYAELNHRANRLAWSLRFRGVVPGMLVGLYHGKAVDLFVAMLGILKAGAGYVPVDPGFPAERIAHILTDAGVRAVVTTTALSSRLDGTRAARIARLLTDADREELLLRPVEAPPAQSGGDPESSIAYVIYTSGSTGRPKGVVVEHRNALTFIDSLSAVYGIRRDDRIYQGFSLAFDASVEEIWAAFAHGGTLCVAPENVARSPADAAEFINRNRLTYFSTVPAFLSLVDVDLPTVRLLVLGGEACPQGLVTRWAQPGRAMLNTYGPTETSVVATCAQCQPGVPVTIGKPLPGYACIVVDEALQPVAPGQPGELLIGGGGVARGYLNQPELTADRFLPNPFLESRAWAPTLYRTQDLVSANPDGSLNFLGRVDDQVKIRGFRVELAEIESVLLENTGIRCASVAVRQSNGLPELAAYVVAEPGAVPDRCAIAAHLRSRLPEYMLPRTLDVLEAFPVLHSGKVDRRNLPEPREFLSRQDRRIEGPATPLEARLLAVWKELFRDMKVSVTDDFFSDLGGHSLLAAQMVTVLRRDLGLTSASVLHLYAHRTIRKFAAHLSDWSTAGGMPPVDADGAPPTTQAEQVFAAVPAWERWTTVTLQAIALLVFEAIQVAPFALGAWLFLGMSLGQIDVATALYWGTVLGFAAWPLMFLTSVAVKWTVIGRIRPGAYPVWSLYYCRWWIANLFQQLSWSNMFVGTPLMAAYYRLMGARVGKGAVIMTPIASAYDLVSIGANAAIGTETHMTGYRVEDGLLKLGRIDIGRDAFVGSHCALGLNVAVGAGARLDDLSSLGDGETIAPDGQFAGSPLASAIVEVPAAAGDAGRPRTFLYGIMHLLLIYAMGYFLILTAAPGAAMLFFAILGRDVVLGTLAILAAVPLSIVWYAACVVMVKRFLIGRIQPGRVSVYSTAWLRLWFLRYLMANTRQILMPLYATIYLPFFYRLLGARIGRNAEVSTVNEVIPDLLDLGEGSFLADECILGGIRIASGMAEVAPVRIGNRTFIGNSAVIRGGYTIGDDVLVGVMSTPVRGVRHVPDRSQWLGSPGFSLPRPASRPEFRTADTFEPDAAMRRKRAVIDAFRIVLPGYVWMTATGLLISLTIAASVLLPLWAVLLLFPLASVLTGVLAVAAVAGIKLLLVGRFTAGRHPLWSEFVMIDDLVTGTFESVSEHILAPMHGTPFVAPLLRLMGCRIGRWAFIDSTFLSEFDLVDIGDFAAINLGATLQTHLFEDRVMKSSGVCIGRGANVANMAIVLYDGELQPGATLAPLSVLMKGETLPAGSHWRGIPCEQADRSQAAREHRPRAEAGYPAEPVREAAQ